VDRGIDRAAELEILSVPCVSLLGCLLASITAALDLFSLHPAFRNGKHMMLMEWSTELDTANIAAIFSSEKKRMRYFVSFQISFLGLDVFRTPLIHRIGKSWE
jgi:hypothetical protein